MSKHRTTQSLALVFAMSLAITACTGSQIGISTRSLELSQSASPPIAEPESNEGNSPPLPTTTIEPYISADPSELPWLQDQTPDPTPLPPRTADEIREDLKTLSAIEFDPSTPLGALCWALWETQKAYLWDGLGGIFLSLVDQEEAENAAQVDESIAATTSRTPSGDDGIVGPTGIVDEQVLHFTEYSLVEALEAASEPGIRNVALDHALPLKYRPLAEEFYGAIDKRLLMDDPIGIELHELTSFEAMTPAETAGFAFCDDVLSEPSGPQPPDPASITTTQPPSTTAITTTTSTSVVGLVPLGMGAPGVSASVGGFTVVWVVGGVPAGAPAVSAYQVGYTAGDGATGTLGVAGGSVTSATVTGLDAATTYEVWVRALNANGWGPWSPPVSVTTPHAAPDG